MTISSLNPIHSIFWLVLVFIYSAGVLISLNFKFIALMLIIIYVGAITILFLFVIMMIDISQLIKIPTINNIIPLMLIIFVNILLQSWWIFKSPYFYNNKSSEWKINNPDILNLGSNLYSEYALPLLLISLLLLVAMVGAILLTLELNLITKRQELVIQHHRNNSWI